MAYIHDSIGVHPNNITTAKNAVKDALYSVASIEYFESIKNQLLEGIDPSLIPPELQSVPNESTWNNWADDILNADLAFM